MRLKLYLAVIVLSLVVIGSVNSSVQEDGILAIKTVSGYLFVWNKKDNHFTLDVKGKEVKPQTDTQYIFMSVDGIVLQVASAPISAFLKDAKSKKFNDSDILKAHQEWEADYLGGLSKKKLTVETAPQKLSNGKVALFWKYDTPEGSGGNVKKQFYLAMVSRNHVVLLNGVVTTETNDAAVQQLLLDTGATLKTSSDKINVKKLQEEIRRGGSP